MMSLQAMLQHVGEAFAEITPLCYHYWRPVMDVPCIIWAETGEDDAMNADNAKTEQVIAGSVDFFTKTEYDPLIDSIQDKLADLGVAWSLDSVMYEPETNLIHYSWSWRKAYGETGI